MSLKINFKLNKESKFSYIDQIYHYFKEIIQSEMLAYGTKITSIRDLSSLLEINKISVITAYERLISDGYLLSKPGSGYYVNYKANKNKNYPNKNLFINEDKTNIEQLPDDVSMHITKTIQVEKALENFNPASFGLSGFNTDLSQSIPLGSVYSAFDIIPIDDIRSSARHVLNGNEISGISYDYLQGLPKLRKKIAEEIDIRNIPINSIDNIIITSGVSATINLILETFTNIGDYIACEVPCYGMIFSLMKLKKLNIIEIPRNNDILELTDSVIDEINKKQVKLIFVNPSIHNPTGTVLNSNTRFHLLQVAQQSGSVIIELDIYNGLNFGELIQPTLASLDGLKRTIYISSFVRTIAPGIKVSYIIAKNNFIKALLYRKTIIDIAASNIDQLIIAEFLERGLLKKHINKLKDTLISRRDILISMLKKLAPANSTWIVPEGGNFLWFDFPEGATPAEIVDLVSDQKVIIAPGNLFYPTNRLCRSMRLSYGVLAPVQTYSALEKVFTIWSSVTLNKKRCYL